MGNVKLDGSGHCIHPEVRFTVQIAVWITIIMNVQCTVREVGAVFGTQGR